MSATDFHCTPEQAIAATLGGGECVLVYGEDEHGYDGWWCQSCGEWFAASFRRAVMTLDVYSHAVPKNDELAAASINSMLRGDAE